MQTGYFFFLFVVQLKLHRTCDKMACDVDASRNEYGTEFQCIILLLYSHASLCAVYNVHYPVGMCKIRPLQLVVCVFQMIAFND